MVLVVVDGSGGGSGSCLLCLVATATISARVVRRGKMGARS